MLGIPTIDERRDTILELIETIRPAIILTQEVKYTTLMGNDRHKKAWIKSFGYDGGLSQTTKPDTGVFFDSRVFEVVLQKGDHMHIDLESDRRPVGKPRTRLQQQLLGQEEPIAEFAGRYTAMRLRLKYGTSQSSEGAQDEFLAVSFHGHKNGIKDVDRFRSIARFKGLVRKYAQEHNIPAITGGDFNSAASLYNANLLDGEDIQPTDQVHDSMEPLLQGHLEIPEDEKRWPSIDYFYVSRPKAANFVFRTSDRKGFGYHSVAPFDHQPIMMTVNVIEPED
jgi:hypothetical protein